MEHKVRKHTYCLKFQVENPKDKIINMLELVKCSIEIVSRNKNTLRKFNAPVMCSTTPLYTIEINMFGGTLGTILVKNIFGQKKDTFKS